MLACLSTCWSRHSSVSWAFSDALGMVAGVAFVALRKEKDTIAGVQALRSGKMAED